jgi:hypothetical protein
MKTVTALLLVACAVGCGASPTPPATSPTSETAPSTPTGATSKQAQDEAARKLSHDECLSLGTTIADACRDTNTRSAQIEGWCSDIVAGVGTGSWIADCEKHVKYMDAMCITSNTSVRAMMDCDSEVQR